LHGHVFPPSISTVDATSVEALLQPLNEGWPVASQAVIIALFPVSFDPETFKPSAKPVPIAVFPSNGAYKSADISGWMETCRAEGSKLGIPIEILSGDNYAPHRAYFSLLFDPKLKPDNFPLKGTSAYYCIDIFHIIQKIFDSP
jgi:hypothetical protein